MMSDDLSSYFLPPLSNSDNDADTDVDSANTSAWRTRQKTDVQDPDSETIDDSAVGSVLSEVGSASGMLPIPDSLTAPTPLAFAVSSSWLWSSSQAPIPTLMSASAFNTGIDPTLVQDASLIASQGPTPAAPIKSEVNEIGAPSSAQITSSTQITSDPTLYVNAANPSDVNITVSGLATDYSGTVTFTDSTGKTDVVPIASNGTYSANLSNLTEGSLTYLMTVTDPQGNVITVDPTAMLGDGSANAPGGVAQLPNVLSNYLSRPSWMVAGVDYAVGPHSTPNLNPANISMAGVTINSSSKTVSITGNNVTISGYDFNGWTIQVSGGNDTITDCTFELGASPSAYQIQALSTATNLTIEYSTFDSSTWQQAGSNESGIIAFGGSNITVLYDLFKNFPQHVLEMTQNAGAASTLTYEYNLIEDGGLESGAHMNFLQWNGGAINDPIVEYNTVYQTQQAASGEFFQFDPSFGASIVNATLAYNTMMAVGTAGGQSGTYLLHAENPSGSTQGNSTGSAYDNFVDISGAYGMFYPIYSPANWPVSNNVDMKTGEIIQSGNSEVPVTTVTSVIPSPSNGTEFPGDSIVFIIDLSQAVTVAGTPTLNLNDGGTATYTGGSGSGALTFSYTVASTDSSVSALAITAVNLPNGASISDLNGNKPNFIGALTTFSGLQVDPPSDPTVTSIAESPATGDLNVGKSVALTLVLNEAVTVAGGTPTLTLNDGGTAIYAGGSGTSGLIFSYTVASGQNVAELAATAVNLNGASITDSSHNTANMSLTGLAQIGPQIDTHIPAAPIIATDFIVNANTVTLSGASEANSTVSVFDGGNLLGTAAANGAGAWSVTTATLANGEQSFIATCVDPAGTLSPSSVAVNLTIDPTTTGSNLLTNGGFETGDFTGWTLGGNSAYEFVRTTSPYSGQYDAQLGSSGSDGTLSQNIQTTAGQQYVVDFWLLNGGGIPNDFSVKWNGQSVLSLGDAAVEGYTEYTIDVIGAAGTSSLEFDSRQDPSVWRLDNVSVTAIAGNGPVVSSIVESPTSGDLNGGKTVTFTLNVSEAVTVNTSGGTPTLTLNDGGAATYTGGSGSGALTFSYTVGAGQNTGSLAATAVNLNSATITDGSGNAANLSLTALTQTGPQIDTMTPIVSSVATSGTGISSGNGDLTVGSVVTLTVNLTETVAVNTTGGSPTLTLNDGGSATYTGGSGTSALIFNYTVGAGQNTADLAVTAYNANGSAVTNGAGTVATMTGAATNPAGTLHIDTTTPTITAIGEFPANGDLDAGKTVAYTLTMSEAVTVNTTGGSPTLSLNDGGTATYTGGSGTNALTFSYTVLAGQNTPDLMITAVNLSGATMQDGAGNAANLSLSGITQGSPAVDTTPPTVSSVTATSGDYNGGKVLTLTLNMSEPVNVTGTPTLTLNDGGTASYVSGSGTGTLTFSYTVATGQNTAALQVTGVTGTITDLAGNALSTSGLPETFTGIIVDTTTPAITSIAESPSSGDLNAGNTVTLTLNLNEAVTVNTAGGSPTLSLNDGGIASYSGGSGTSALTFSYTVATGQNTASLAATAVNLNSATILDGAGNAANLSFSGLNQTGPQIDTTTPSVSSVTTSGTGITSGAGDLGVGKTVTFTVGMSEAVTVSTTGGTPTLTLNDGGTATYSGGSGTNALTFSYTVATGQNTADLAITAYNSNGGTIINGAGTAATMTGAATNPAGTLQIDTTTPAVSSVTTSGTGITSGAGDLGVGKTVTFTVGMSEAVTVSTTGGAPTLTLNDGGTATYSGGSGTSALTFSYTVTAGQKTVDLAVTAYNANGGTITNGAGTAAILTGAVTNPTGTLQIDTTTPSVLSVSESPASGVLDAGKTVTLTLNMSDAVAVNTTGGTPTLTLNDGGTATYTGGSGTSALTFSYTVAAGQNIAQLSATAVNLNSAIIANGAGTAANLSLTGLTQTGPQIDTATPIISSLSESPSSGDLGVSKSVTLTLNISEAVTVNTTGGTPTLTLNDGGIATYTGGSGTTALTFSYTVAAGQNTSDLAATAVNLNSATILDGSGNAANLSLTGLAQTGPQIDTTTPTVSLVTTLGTGINSGNGDLTVGGVVTLTVNLTEAVAVNTTGGSPTLTLNDGGAAIYTAGSGTSALTFSYAVGAGQNTADLAVTAYNANGSTISNGAGTAAILTGAVTNPTGTLQIDTTTPTITGFAESPSSGHLKAGKTVAYTLTMSEAVTVNATGGSPILTLNDGGTATYTGGSGTNALTFSYTVLAGQNTPDLMITTFNLNGSTIADGAGNAANLSLSGITQGSPSVDTTPPTVSSVTATAGSYNAGKVLTLTLNMSEAVNVTGTPTLTLNDGGTASYVSGTGTSTLTFSYTVATGQSTAALQATGVTGTITDLAGNALSTAGLPETFTDVIVDTTTPAITSIAESPASGDLNAGNAVTFTLNMSEAVTVAGSIPTLTLNDGGTATYVGGSGGSALTFSYTVGAGQNVGSLAATVVNLNSATIKDGSGNAAALSLTGLTQTGPQINTLPNPVAPAGTSADLIMSNGATGNYEIYNIGENAILAAYPLTQISSPWKVAGFGSFSSTDTSDMLVRNSNTGALEVYDINNNNITSTVSMGQVGLEWAISGFGDFSGRAGETDMLMRNVHTGNFEIYDISNNKITSAAPMGQVGSEWSVAGFGDFSGHANETDMLMRNVWTGQFEIFDISGNQLTSAAPMGQVGLEWHVAGFGDFSGNANETDMLMRNLNTGKFEIYDITHNALTSAAPMGQVGMEWSVIAFGDFSSNSGVTDMLMQNAKTGQFEVYDINHNQITAAQNMGQVGSEWTAAGVADTSAAQLTQAMASFAPAAGVSPTSLQIDEPIGQPPPSILSVIPNN